MPQAWVPARDSDWIPIQLQAMFVLPFAHLDSPALPNGDANAQSTLPLGDAISLTTCAKAGGTPQQLRGIIYSA
jgi:hypothetical protein